MSLDLSGLTDAQITTSITDVNASILRTLGSQEYQIGARRLKREMLKDLKEYLSDLSIEQSLRSDATGGTGVVEFAEPL